MLLLATAYFVVSTVPRGQACRKLNPLVDWLACRVLDVRTHTRGAWCKLSFGFRRPRDTYSINVRTDPQGEDQVFGLELPVCELTQVGIDMDECSKS